MTTLERLVELTFDGAGIDCWAGVTRQGEYVSCDKPATAVAWDDAAGECFPVCSFHDRVGHTVTLANVIAAAAKYATRHATVLGKRVEAGESS